MAKKSRSELTLRQRAQSYAIDQETWFQNMSREPVPVANKIAKAWMDGYNAGRLAKLDAVLRSLNADICPVLPSSSTTPGSEG